MAQRTRMYVLLGVLVALLAAVFYSRSGEPSQPSVLSADTRFQPLNVKEPQLRLDMLQQLQKEEYTGSKRNIFVVEAVPAPASAAKSAVEVPRPFVGPQPPPPPAPVQVPAEFFGYEYGRSGRRVAFFKDGDDVLVVSEGEVFLGRFRLGKIGDNSADVEEVSSGRHTAVPLVQEPDAPSVTEPQAGTAPAPTPN